LCWPSVAQTQRDRARARSRERARKRASGLVCFCVCGCTLICFHSSLTSTYFTRIASCFHGKGSSFLLRDRQEGQRFAFSDHFHRNLYWLLVASWVCSFLYLFLWFFDVHVVSFLCEGGVSGGAVCVFFLPLFACIDVSRRKKRREACVLSEVLFWSWESVKLYASQLSSILGFEFLEAVNCWWWWRLLKMLNLLFFFFPLSPTRWSSDALVSHKC